MTLYRNMGKADRSIRIALAIIIALLYFSGVISGVLAIILGVVSLIFIATSMVSFCPMYVPFKWNTSEKKKDEKIV
ncbi:MAG: DUF2892 domain-containing protein [Cyclobacteriaceae bacterium]|nr:DUF2892 domain-containing protein [Cyclobacteriaceae bacterium]